MSDGARIVVRRFARPGRPRLVISHGNGLAVTAYAPFWERLLDDFDVVLFDMRNHGVNPLHEFDAHQWPRFARDVGEVFAGVARHFGSCPTVGVFHSLSAIAALTHLLDYGPATAGLVLFDPPLLPPESHPAHALARESIDDLVARSLRRPEGYADPSELGAHYARHSAFARLVPGAADLLARATLVERGGVHPYELSCPREYEAHVFASNRETRLWEALKRPLPVPVRIVAGDPHLPKQGPPPLICAALAEDAPIDYQPIAGTTHFLQIEKPAECARSVREFALTCCQASTAANLSRPA